MEVFNRSRTSSKAFNDLISSSPEIYVLNIRGNQLMLHLAGCGPSSFERPTRLRLHLNWFLRIGTNLMLGQGKKPVSTIRSVAVANRNRGLSMSRRRWQSVAPGVSPGFSRMRFLSSLERATENVWIADSRFVCRPSGARGLLRFAYPGLTPGALKLSPASLAR
jgi:hypothetical protein